MAMTNETIAVIGTGYMGAQHLEIWHSLGARLIVCSADEKTGTELAEKYSASFYKDYLKMMEEEKPDAVSVCLPTKLHFDAAKAALVRNIAVLCEKPFTVKTSEAEELCSLAKEKNVLLMVGHPLRFGKVYAYLKNCISDGRFGKLTQLSMYRNSTVPNWSVGGWLLNTTLSGGALKDLHIHETDMINYLLGLPQSVTTVGSLMQCSSVYRYPDELGVTASGGWRNVKDLPFMSGYDAVFEHAVVKCTDQTVQLYTDEGVCDPIPSEDFPGYLKSAASLENEITYFAKCLEEGASPAICLPESTIATMRLNEAEMESYTLGQTIKLN